jgi:hypothetical protein
MANSIADNFKGLPIEDLIVSPLVGMAKGQAKLNDVTWKYINEVGFTTDKDGNTVPRSLDIQINRYVQVAGQPKPELQSMKSMVPLLPLIPLPALAITQADIEFTMEIQQSDSSTDTSSSEVDTSVDVKYKSWWGLSVSANVTGKVATSKENTRKTDNTAKYDVKVHAEQLPPTEGMLKLSDALITMMDPVVIGGSSGTDSSGGN